MKFVCTICDVEKLHTVCWGGARGKGYCRTQCIGEEPGEKAIVHAVCWEGPRGNGYCPKQYVGEEPGEMAIVHTEHWEKPGKYSI